MTNIPIPSILSASPVAHVCTARGWRGGEQQALNLACGMQARGLKALVIAQPASPMAERARAAGLPVRELAYRGEWDLWAAWKLSRILKAEQAVLAHAHDGHAVMLAGLSSKLAGIPALCTRRVDFALRGAWKYRRWMKRIICISGAIRNICADGGLPAERMPVVLSGIDIARIRDAKADIPALRAGFGEMAKDEKKLFVLNVASLTDHKGQKYLIDAMPYVLRKVPNAKLLIAGVGELEFELKAQANELALDKDVLEFTGFREDVPALLHMCDLFVMSSHLEGLCTSAMDAMAAGKAVVATRAGGLPEVVKDGQTGVLVPAREPQALAEAIVDLLHDHKKRERMGQRGQEVASLHFGFDRMVEGTLQVYAEMLS